MLYEVAGMPSAGRTSLVREVERAARSNGTIVRNHHGGGHFITAAEKHTSLFNTAVFARNLHAHIEAVSYPSSLNLFDRGVVDALIFTRALQSAGRELSNAHSIISLLSDPEILGELDHVTLVHGKPQVSLDRESQESGVRPSEFKCRLFYELQKETLAAKPLLESLGVPVTQIDSEAAIEERRACASLTYSSIVDISARI